MEAVSVSVSKDGRVSVRRLPEADRTGLRAIDRCRVRPASKADSSEVKDSRELLREENHEL